MASEKDICYRCGVRTGDSVLCDRCFDLWVAAAFGGDKRYDDLPTTEEPRGEG